MNRRLFSHVAMSATIASANAAHATDWWLYMASEDRCVEAAQGALGLGSFTASPEALIKYYRSQGKDPLQHKDPNGLMVAVDDGDGTSTVFFTVLDSCQLFAATMRFR